MVIYGADCNSFSEYRLRFEMGSPDGTAGNKPSVAVPAKQCKGHLCHGFERIYAQ